MNVTADGTTVRVAGEVRAWLARRSMAARKAAAELGWSDMYLSRRLTGQTAFSVSDLAAVGELLGVRPERFFDYPEDDWDEPTTRPSSRRGVRSSCFTPVPAAAAALSAPGGSA